MRWIGVITMIVQCQQNCNNESKSLFILSLMHEHLDICTSMIFPRLCEDIEDPRSKVVSSLNEISLYRQNMVEIHRHWELAALVLSLLSSVLFKSEIESILWINSERCSLASARNSVPVLGLLSRSLIREIIARRISFMSAAPSVSGNFTALSGRNEYGYILKVSYPAE
jgi:hypothetical protein